MKAGNNLRTQASFCSCHPNAFRSVSARVLGRCSAGVAVLQCSFPSLHHLVQYRAFLAPSPGAAHLLETDASRGGAVSCAEKLSEPGQHSKAAQSSAASSCTRRTRVSPGKTCAQATRSRAPSDVERRASRPARSRATTDRARCEPAGPSTRREKMVSRLPKTVCAVRKRPLASRSHLHLLMA